jgi:uncharacterized membrane protein (UPF0136 family)
MVSVIAGAVVGVPSLLGFATVFGAAGGAWGFALAEAISVTCQVVFVVRGWPRPRPDVAP